jgi:hypothetical protein
MIENVINNQKHKKIVGFRVDATEYNTLKQYADILYNQQIQDPETKQNCR